jgi:hypothetical protein
MPFGTPESVSLAPVFWVLHFFPFPIFAMEKRFFDTPTVWRLTSDSTSVCCSVARLRHNLHPLLCTELSSLNKCYRVKHHKNLRDIITNNMLVHRLSDYKASYNHLQPSKSHVAKWSLLICIVRHDKLDDKYKYLWSQRVPVLNAIIQSSR